jgi:hypothetical protein
MTMALLSKLWKEKKGISSPHLTLLSYHVPHQIIIWHTNIWVTTAHAKPLRESTHFLYQYTSPIATLPSILFYKDRLYIFMQHRRKHWCGSLFTSLPHHHLVREEIITSIFSSHSFHPTLIYTRLFNSVCHMAIWAQIALPPWSFHTSHLGQGWQDLHDDDKTCMQSSYWELILENGQWPRCWTTDGLCALLVTGWTGIHGFGYFSLLIQIAPFSAHKLIRQDTAVLHQAIIV